jgi:glycosyltransferase involved in cell wall biosynthesis
MKILHVTAQFPPKALGGAWIYAKDLCKELIKKGHDVEVLCADPYSTLPYLSLTEREHEGIKVYEVSENRRGDPNFLKSYFNPKIGKIFEDFLLRIKPHIIHFHTPGCVTCAPMIVAKESGVPYIVTLHDFWFICHREYLLLQNGKICEPKHFQEGTGCVGCSFTKILNISLNIWINKVPFKFFSRMPLRRYQKEIEDAPLLSFCSKDKRAIIGAILKRQNFMKDALSEAKKVICPSMWLKRIYEDFGFCTKDWMVLDYGYSIKKSKRVKKIERGKPLCFAYIGAIAPHKGVNVLVDAANILEKKGILDDNLQIKIFGKALRKEYFERLQKRCKNSLICFEGAFERRELEKIFSAIDVLVLPSLWYENRPLVIQEAFASNVLVIASDIGGMKEAMEGGGKGLLFKAGDAKDLANKILYCVKNPEFINECKEYLKDYKPKSMREHADEIERVYNSSHLCYHF